MGKLPPVFWALWIFDALASAVVLYFFLIGLLDGSVSSFNMGLWMGILAFLGAVLGGSWALKKAGHPWIGLGVLSILALPASLYLLFVLLVLICQPRWN